MPSHGSAVVLNLPACVDDPGSLGCLLLPLLSYDTGGGGLLAGRAPGPRAAAKPFVAWPGLPGQCLVVVLLCALEKLWEKQTSL